MTPLEAQTLMTEEAYLDAVEQYGDEFKAGMGAEAIQELLVKSTRKRSDSSTRRFGSDRI